MHSGQLGVGSFMVLPCKSTPHSCRAAPPPYPPAPPPPPTNNRPPMTTAWTPSYTKHAPVPLRTSAVMCSPERAASLTAWCVFAPPRGTARCKLAVHAVACRALARGRIGGCSCYTCWVASGAAAALAAANRAAPALPPSLVQVENVNSLGWDCMAQVNRIRQDSADDFRLSMKLFRSCQLDANKFCAKVEPGHMRVQVRRCGGSGSS